MKKNILALAVISAMAAPVAMADKHSTTLYGQINAAVNSTTDKGMKTTDRDSRLGVKGSADLGNGLKGIYKMEFGVITADSFSGLSGRNTFVGLGGNFGTVLVGRNDTPFKNSQPKDLFGDATYADIGKSQMAGGLGIKAGEVRADNTITYISPEFNGIKLMAMGISNQANEAKDSGFGNAVSGAITYGSKKKGLYVAAAMNVWDAKGFDQDATKETYKMTGVDKVEVDKAAKGAVEGKTFTETRLSAQYAANGVIVTGLYQTFDDGYTAKNEEEGSNIQVGVGYKMGNFMPKAKFSMVDREDKELNDGNAFAIGLDYKVAKATTAYVEFVSADKKMLTVKKSDLDTDKEKKSLTDFSVGIKHKF